MTWRGVKGDKKRGGAWYFAIAYAGYVRSAIRLTLESSVSSTPKDILDKVNTSVYKDAKISEVFATLSIVTYNSTSKVLKYSGAGDLPLIYRNYKSGQAKQINSKGMLLGFSEHGFFEDQSVEFGKGDIAILLTDGLIESRNSAGLAFGTDNLIRLLQNIPADTDPLVFLQTELSAYTDGKFEDDISLITIRGI